MTKKSRRLGIDLVDNNKAFERRPYPPGVHGRGHTKDSEYSLQLKKKWKVRFAYGVFEKQFRRYCEEADRHPGKTGDTLLQIPEPRLDNAVYRAGFAATRRQTRQLVVYGYFLVNDKKVNIPLYRVKAHDITDVAEKSMDLHPLAVAHEIHGERTIPTWLEARSNRMRILVHQLPVREQIVTDVQEQMIVELYPKQQAPPG